jgi:hypothetical protein
MQPEQFLQFVIRPVLASLPGNTKAAEQIVLGTALKESGLKYLHQIGGGPAMGVYQCEPATHRDIWKNYLDRREHLAFLVRQWCIHGMKNSPVQLCGNHFYATAICRAHYLRRPEAFPPPGDAAGLAAYWKKYYNTESGAGHAVRDMPHFERAISICDRV